MKDTSKATVIGYYKPIACLALMGKRLTSIFSEAMYGHLSSQELLTIEQKGRRTPEGQNTKIPSHPEELSKKTY